MRLCKNKSIMKQTISISKPTLSEKNMNLTSRIANWTPIVRLAALYSALLEEPVSPIRTLRILNAQLALFVLCLTANASIVVTAICLVWFALSIYACKKDYATGH